MTPIVFINCTECPYVDMILSRKKIVETRSTNTLKALCGKRVYIAETGHGKPVIKGMVTIGYPVMTQSCITWNGYRILHCVPKGSTHDWNRNTKQKYLYLLSDAEPCEPFTPPEGKRHGRVWMEYNEKR